MVIERYQTTTHVPEALHRLVESYLSLGVKSEAQEAAAVLGYNFPGSDWYQDSYFLMTGEGTPAPIRREARLVLRPVLTGLHAGLAFDPRLRADREARPRLRALGADGGLGALTGETGAGKSILIDALGLALGARAESAAVRRGATQASVAASFDLPKDHPAHAILAEQGLDDEDVLTLRRMVGADGRGRAFVNDQPASVALLRRLGDTLVEIQGQMEQHGLLGHGDASRLARCLRRAGEAGRRRCAPPGRPGGRPSRRAPTPRRPPPPRGATRISCAMR